MSRKEKLLHGQQEKVAEMQRKKIIEVKNVSMRFRLTDDKIMSLKEFVTRKLSGKYKTSEFWALKNVSFDVYRGEVVGIIGHNGAGKSTILKVISGILKPTEGSVTCGGNIVPMLELGSGFDHDLTGRENIFLNGAILGYTEEFLQSKYDEIVAFSELGEFIDVPIRNYSSGMLMRLAFSIATVVNPQILIVDEILAVGDANFQEKSRKRMLELMSGGTTVLFVSHNPIAHLADLLQAVRYKQHGRTAAHKLQHTLAAFFLKVCVTDSENLVHNKNLRIYYRRD